MGVLTEQGAPKWHPAAPEVHEAARRAAEFCRSCGVNIADVALRFCFQYPRVGSTFVGMSTQAEVKNNLRVLSQQVNPSMLQQVRDILRPVLNRTWPSGRPENTFPQAQPSQKDQATASAD